MPITPSDVSAVNDSLRPLAGLAPWRVRLGHGTFITLEFGQPIVDAAGKERGEWYLWVYFSAWRIDSLTEIVAASEDDLASLPTALASLEGRELKSIAASGPSLSLELDFGDLWLRAFPVSSTETEHWMLFTPAKSVLAAGPGATWSNQ